MKKILFLLLTFLTVITLKAQNDPQAKAILDQVSARNKAYKTVSSDFTITTTSSRNGSSSSRKGSLIMKGEKYLIRLPESEIYFDGKDVYNYLPESNEVNITKPKEASSNGNDFFVTNPQDIFKIYQKNFKYKFIRENVVKGKNIYEIDLYPVDLKKNYSRIRMQVDKNTSQIVSLKAFFKDGTQHTVSLDKFETNQTLPDSLFVFDQAKHPGVEVIDLRF